ncbi:hypothetical protein [Simkania sp.]|uniref:hypothetical protein n=1 Tax=Simkania sp. TaxID=34094 RepID=UPI003B52B4CD
MNLMRAFFLATSFLLFGTVFATDTTQFTVNLKNPIYKDGVISTDQGGVITSPELRIQARHIVYINKVEKGKPIHQVIAEGDLMLDNLGRIYVGRRLEYDFITKTGIVYEGATAVDLWFLGGEKIRLNPDRSYYLYNAFITTSESKKADWKIQSRELEIDRKSQLTAKNVTFRFWDTPILWVPAFKSNLIKPLTETPVRYKVEWDKGLWPKLSMRYRIFSWENLDLFFRLNVRPSKGVGGAIETNYRSPDKRKRLQTKSYADHDAFYRDRDSDKARFHYRLQGLYEARSEDNRSQIHLTYDKLSDRNMQVDFPTPDFEVSTVKETFLKIRNYQDWMILGINARPRINSFQGLKQELPESFWTPHPFTIGPTGIISENRLRVSYLDYVSANDIESAVPDFHSARIASHNELYRPFSYKGFNITPLVGFTGIFYNESRDGGAVGQAVLNYEMFIDLTLRRHYQTLRHVLQPYIHYKGLTHPTISPDRPYIFDIDDGFNRLYQLQTGVRNYFYLKKFPLFEPNFIADIYLYAFFADRTFKKTIPKVQGHFTWNFRAAKVTSQIGWNVEEQVFDFANVGLAWTINENFAFKTEFRHRSRFEWRKNEFNNYIMEVTRGIPELLRSPLSDGRNTLLTRLQMKIAPQWTARFESHIGWGRGGEPNYNEAKVELITLISTSWKLRLIFTHSPAPKRKNDRFSFAFSLVRK